MFDFTGSLDAGVLSVFTGAFESPEAVVSADFLFSPQAIKNMTNVQTKKDCFLRMVKI